MKFLVLPVTLFSVLMISDAQAQTTAKPGLNLAGAKKVIGAAVAEANKLNAPAPPSRWSTMVAT